MLKVSLMWFGSLFVPVLCFSQTAFEGTWRPDPQRPDPSSKPETIEIADGTYACLSCAPPYKVPADGRDHAVTGNPYFETLSVDVVDARTVRRTAKRGGQTVAEMLDVISADGKSRKGTQTLMGMMPKTVELRSTYSRIAAGPAKSHALSGQWRALEMDLTNHDEDTTYKVTGKTIAMTDRLGRSFTATVDGPDAPYLGDRTFTSVSLRLIDPHTLEESDKKDGKVVHINRWAIDSDGKTVHATFDDTHGHVQHQTGHRISP